jgi:asparagine synthase (glutamine-hydrolysing)
MEVRTPYLDHRLVEFATALPMRYKIAGAEQKRILRAALKPLVPADVLRRSKRGFGLPLREWFRGEHRGFVAERLLQRDNKIFEFIEPEPVSRLITNHNRGHRDFSDRIWALIWLQEWFEQFA